jgi:hypothetical protein
VEPLASAPRSKEQSGFREAVVALFPEVPPRSTSCDDAGGHVAGGADVEAALEGNNSQDFFLPVVLVVVHAVPDYSADVVTARLAATSATMPLPKSYDSPHCHRGGAVAGLAYAADDCHGRSC